jgi:hypothetical protein
MAVLEENLTPRESQSTLRRSWTGTSELTRGGDKDAYR